MEPLLSLLYLTGCISCTKIQHEVMNNIIESCTTVPVVAMLDCARLFAFGCIEQALQPPIRDGTVGLTVISLV